MDIRQLECFLGVASELHFSRAAEKLFIAQPALSRHIQQLEEELDVLLFERDKRNVKLTSAGAYLQKEAIRILSQLDYIKQRTQQVHKGEEGELRIAHPGSAVYSVLPTLLSALKLYFPKIRTALSEVLETKLFESLHNYQVDVGFVREPIPDKYLNSRLVFEEYFSLVVPPNHVLTKENFKGLHQVKDEPFILPPRYAGSVYHDILLKMCEREGFLPNIIHESNFGTTILKLVENNLGVSLLPSSYRYGSAINVRFIDLEMLPDRTQLSLVWRKDDTNPILHNFLNTAQSVDFRASIQYPQT
ncbi:LysR family transcriptional regulator [Flectobacillus major]|uniref:LysR family transcriptional regulator n=1 Tax=Flectobacillus major TaxID=103 RepID=UPI000417F6C9|nr:LysR substrate-binding domain-containing protein [Flectobacillus major]